MPLLASRFETIAADLPSFGDSGLLTAPATTENVGHIFHAFVTKIGSPLHVVAHDFGAWVAFSWALIFPGDFRSLTLIDAGIPGVTLTEDVQLSDYKRKWNFIFQMLPDLPAGHKRRYLPYDNPECYVTTHKLTLTKTGTRKNIEVILEIGRRTTRLLRSMLISVAMTNPT